MPKIKPHHYTTIQLADQERWLGYTWGDIEDMSATLRMDLLGDGGMLMKAGLQNPRCLNTLLLTGLKHWDPQLRYEGVQDMVQARLNSGGKVSDLIEGIYKAMRIGGFLGEEAGEKEQEAGPVGPGQSADTGPAHGDKVRPLPKAATAGPPQP